MLVCERERERGGGRREKQIETEGLRCSEKQTDRMRG